MNATETIDEADEILRQLARQTLDEFEAELALRFVRGDHDGLLPLKFYPARLQDFVRAHSTPLTNQQPTRHL
jgi:hypothetical protein